MNKEFLVNSIGHWQGLEQILNDFQEILKNEVDDIQENQTNILNKLSEIHTELSDNFEMVSQKLDLILDALNTNGQAIVNAIDGIATTTENNKV